MRGIRGTLGLFGLTYCAEKTYSTSGRSSVRLERIQNIPTYDRGFDFLTRFYRSKTASKIRYIRPKLGHKASEEVVDISLSDDEAEGSAAIGTFRDDHKNDDSGLRGKEPDSIGLAAGLPGAWPDHMVPC